MYKIFDAILQNDESEADAIDYARGMVWSECEYQVQDLPTHSRYIDTVDGIDVYYDYGADYYFFVDDTED